MRSDTGSQRSVGNRGSPNGVLQNGVQANEDKDSQQAPSEMSEPSYLTPPFTPDDRGPQSSLKELALSNRLENLLYSTESQAGALLREMDAIRMEREMDRERMRNKTVRLNTMITKYNAIVFGVGILIFMWVQKPHLRSIFLSRHFIFSVFIFLFTQLPVFVWNFEHQFSSFQFHLNKRMDTELSIISFLKNSITFILATALSISPLATIYLYTKKNKIGLGKVDQLALSCAYYVLLVTICSCIFLSIFTNVLYYWSIVGFILFMPYLSLLFRKTWEVIFQLSYGLAFVSLLTINSVFLPLTTFSGKVDRETAIIYKWEQVVNQISNFQRINEVEDIVFTDYRIASLYGFHSGNTNVDASMQNRETQFDIWRSKKQFYPTKSLIIADKDFPIHSKLTKIFREITYLGQIETNKYNRKIKNFDVYLAKK